LKLFKTMFAKYAAWLLHVLARFGPWGVFVIALTDNVVPVIPLDAVVAGYVYREPHRAVMYILLASVGAMLGSLVPFFIGRAGGELLLLKHVDRARIERLQQRYAKRESLFVAIPSMLPPPTPMKLIILSAGAFEMSTLNFVLSILIGRILRFSILTVLVIKFGPQIVDFAETAAKQHLLGIGIGLLVLIGAVLVWKRWLGPRLRRGAVEN